MPVIEVNNISKKYNIVHQKGDDYITIRDVLTNLVKHPLKFAKDKMKQKLGIGIEEFWALKDIDFSVEKGEVLGIIGPNGAGKSTLLKLLSQITPPTTGEIKMKGRIGSLLEVGTGFNPELTGRENVYLNGAILGMTKKEIERKFDEIVDFSGIEKFIDTPVKRYSSGMKVRLGFSVAAHLEPDILLVDEVLAVGDAEFRKKCLGKMDEVTKKTGRTILFVSHNMAAIQNLCKKCILLKNGKIKKEGETNKVISYYLNKGSGDSDISKYKHDKTDILANDSAGLISAKLTDKQGKPCSGFGSTNDIYISIEYKIKKKLPVLFIDCYLLNEKGDYILHTTDNDAKECVRKIKKPGIYISQCKIPKNLLNTGEYFVTVGGRIPKIQQFFSARNILSFRVNSTGGPTSIDAPRSGIICPELEWTTNLR